MKTLWNNIWNKLKSIDYRLYLAKWLNRVHRCGEDTEPALGIAPIGVGALLCIIILMGFGMEAEHPTLSIFIKMGIKTFIVGALLGFSLVYGFWEFSQGYKWSRKWSDDYVHKHQEDE